MSNFPRIIALVATMSLTAHLSYGNSIEVGDWVHFNATSGTLGGGAFTVDDVTDAAVADFLTFCIQETQYIDYSSNFRIGSITNYADDAAGPDPLDARTEWIMSNFSRGLLGAYSSDDIQWSIWALEGEQTGDRGNSAALIRLADVAVLGGWTNDGVKALNLFWADGTAAQDQIAYLPSTETIASVPEPATIVLLATGLIVAVGLRSRASRRRNASGVQRRP